MSKKKEKGKEQEEKKEKKGPGCGGVYVCSEIKNITHPLRYYEFTKEELAVLGECDKESFYNRCVPFGLLFASLTFAAIRTGFLRRNPHFGSVPKVLAASILGHAYGRYSSVESCKAKILEDLPKDSHLAQTFRQYQEKENEKDKDKGGKRK